MSLRFKMVGGVIRAGEPILDILPDEEKLLIEARVELDRSEMEQLGSGSSCAACRRKC